MYTPIFGGFYAAIDSIMLADEFCRAHSKHDGLIFVCLTNLASGVQVGSAFKSASLAAILAPLLHCICVMPRSAITPATILREMSKSVVIRR